MRDWKCDEHGSTTTRIPCCGKAESAAWPSLALLVAGLEQTYTAEGVLVLLNEFRHEAATPEGRATLLALTKSYRGQIAT